jgi:hypothetical protein
LSEAERGRIIAVANEPRFADTPPARIVPELADEGIYIASESSFHRVLRARGQMNRRGRAQPPRPSRPPSTHIASRSGEVWCWDVTFLPAQVQGRWFYFYLILDLYSRKCPSGNILSPWNRLCFNPCGAIRRNRYDVDTQEPGPIRPQQAALPQ